MTFLSDPPLTKQDQVLQAAARCFVDEGFHGSSMSRIAKAAQMSVGHIYHYFESKDAIIAELVRREEARANERLDYFESLDSETLFDALIGKVEEGICMSTELFYSVLVLEILAEATRNDKIAAIVQEVDIEMRRKFSGILAGTLGLDAAESRVEALFTIFGGLSVRSIRNPHIDTDRLVPIIRAAIRGILEANIPPDVTQQG